MFSSFLFATMNEWKNMSWDQIAKEGLGLLCMLVLLFFVLLLLGGVSVDTTKTRKKKKP